MPSPTLPGPTELRPAATRMKTLLVRMNFPRACRKTITLTMNAREPDGSRRYVNLWKSMHRRAARQEDVKFTARYLPWYPKSHAMVTRMRHWDIRMQLFRVASESALVRN
jgi:hypothetical protein